jgi:hypothetical protein
VKTVLQEMQFLWGDSADEYQNEITTLQDDANVTTNKLNVINTGTTVILTMYTSIYYIAVQNDDTVKTIMVGWTHTTGNASHSIVLQPGEFCVVSDSDIKISSNLTLTSSATTAPCTVLIAGRTA